MSAGTLAVRLAAALLPAHSRARYREQWLGEMRDAEEAGIRPAEVAAGALLFSATLARPLPARVSPGPADLLRRSRFAAGLALAAALVGLTRYADFVGVGEFTGAAVYDFVAFLASMLLIAFEVLAPVVAVLLVTAARGVARRVRVAVWLLALAALAPVAKAALDSALFATGASFSLFASPGTAAFPAAALLIAVAGVLLARTWSSAGAVSAGAAPVSSPARGRRLAASIVGGLVLMAVAALCLGDFVTTWAGRVPLVTDQPVGSYYYEEWLALKVQGESLVGGVFVGWAVVAVVVGGGIAASGLLRRASPVRTCAVTLAALCLLVIAYAAVADLLWLMSASVRPTLPTEALLLAGRWGLVAVTMAAVGGVRLTRSRRPRAVAVAA